MFQVASATSRAPQGAYQVVRHIESALPTSRAPQGAYQVVRHLESALPTSRAPQGASRAAIAALSRRNYRKKQERLRCSLRSLDMLALLARYARVARLICSLRSLDPMMFQVASATSRAPQGASRADRHLESALPTSRAPQGASRAAIAALSRRNYRKNKKD